MSAEVTERFKVWTGNNETIIYSPFEYDSTWLIESWWDDLTMHTFFKNHWFKSVYLSAAYVIATNLLTRYMEPRKPKR